MFCKIFDDIDLDTVDWEWEEAHPYCVHFRQYRNLHFFTVTGLLALLFWWWAASPLPSFVPGFVGSYALVSFWLIPVMRIQLDRLSGHLDPDNGEYWMRRAQWLGGRN